MCIRDSSLTGDWMITRSKAKMASSSSDSMNFDINNQLGVPDNGEENSSVEPNMTEETSERGDRGPNNKEKSHYSH